MRTIAHLSDLHFDVVEGAIVEALLEDLRAQPPDLVVVSGDLTQRAKSYQFAAARRFLDRLPAPHLAIPGNHDVAPLYRPMRRTRRPFGRYRRFISPDLCPVYCDAEIAVLGLNTARPMQWKEGSISFSQIQRARRILGALDRGVFRVVFTHHPFLPPPGAPETDLVRGASFALSEFEASGVDLLLAGHLHRAYTGDITTHHAAIKRSILVAQASTATSTRLRAEPNAYNWIAIDGGTVRLHSRAWTGSGFARAEGETFRKVQNRWVQERGKPVPVG